MNIFRLVAAAGANPPIGSIDPCCLSSAEEWTSQLLPDAMSLTAFERATRRTGSPEDAVALNPQPLPPLEAHGARYRAEAVALNPQPLPPRSDRNPADNVLLNPQPLPPQGLFRLLDAAQ